MKPEEKEATMQDNHRVVTGDQLERILGKTRRSTTKPAKGNRVLVWYDGWRNRDRTLRWVGPCIGCGVQTWSFDDGENDPRGVLGDAASWPVTYAETVDGTELEANACAVCANDYDAYQVVLSVAMRTHGKGW